MTIRELQEIFDNIEDKDMEVFSSYDAINGYYFKDENTRLVLTSWNVQPRICL